MDDKEFEKTVSHAQTALANVQENIRFIDAKVAGVLALVFAVVTLGISRLVVVKQVQACLDKVGILGCLEVILGVLAVGALGFVVFYAIKALVARESKNALIKGRHWILFPKIPQDNETAFHVEISNRLKSGLKAEDILQEYADQLSILGGINHEKIANCNNLFVSVGVFCLIVFLLSALSFINAVLTK